MRDLFQQPFLYDRLDFLSGFGSLSKEMPESITQNLNPQFEIREYQEEAFARFIYYLHEVFPNEDEPLHLLFNMATGSGKTLIMAGLILYLYEKGYRNFLFYVDTTNIIKKTQDNFLNPEASKYLFNKEIYIEGARVELTQVENFDDVNENDINICFTTIQQLQSDMTRDRENALTLENFAFKRVVLLSDEAHHMNASTQSQLEALASWENTVESIFNSNKDNLLLEFTATHDYENPDMVEKYRNKVIYRYDLMKFRNDRFSKDIEIVKSDFDEEDRILQAVILNHYKQAIAAKYKIQLKPVILFKAQRTITESQENEAKFHKLIDELTGTQIDRIRESEVDIVQKAFRFFDENDTSSERLAQRLKLDFQEKYCLSVNNDKDKEINQILVNTLEDKENPIRAIFAVHKLNEGWDVLNLFDIVRCYKSRDTRFNKPGKTTMSEAQLIGRGARYLPFIIPKAGDDGHHSKSDDKFRRKFDMDVNHELRVLEELHYHSVDDSRYISEIRSVLIEQGVIDETVVTRDLKLKDSFKESHLYKYGVVWLNEREQRDYQDVASFKDLADLSVRRKNHEHAIHTGSGGVTTVMGDRESGGTQNIGSREIRVVEIEQNVVQSAIARNPFFKFSSLRRYFPGLTSMTEFRTSESYLGGLAITFKGDVSQLEDNSKEKLEGCCNLLARIESELRVQITAYKGSTYFHEKRINAVFTDKTLKFSADNPRADDTHESERLVKIKEWFAFDGLYGTSEEKAFVKTLNTWIAELEETYDDIYLIRNERHFSLYNFSDGRIFEPDFVLFLGKTNGKSLAYQLFIEPKGQHLEEQDRWKEEFLKKISVEYHSRILTEDRKFRVIGVPTFYNSQRENDFKEKLNNVLQGSDQMP